MFIHHGISKIQIFILITYQIFTCYGFHILDTPNISKRIRRQVNCGSFSFKCNSGECISREKLCDGVGDCTDGSDEDLRCLQYTKSCQEFAFRCAYGACVDGDARCNNVKECFDNSDEVACTNRTASSCGDKFACDSGQCINNYLRCDGVKDCTDGSDETFRSCSSTACQEFSFRCAYGACVDGDAKCNGVQECADGSDEAPQLCGGTGVTPTVGPPPVTPAVVPENGCLLPQLISNGQYTIQGISSPPPPGQSVTDYTVLTINCQSSYALYPPNNGLIVCQNNQWVPPVPKCLKTCEPRISESVKTTCTLDDIKTNCSERQVEGALVQMECNHLYNQIDSDVAISSTSVCRDGTWDFGYIKCVPGCGKLVPKGSTFIVGGGSAKKGAFPWHVGIYRKEAESTEYKHICGGSIINPRLILSAAHCFTEESDGSKHDASLFFVGAGKYYREYNEPKDKLAQKHHVKNIIIPVDYKGFLSSFSADISFIILETPLTMTHVVQPVCVDWQNLYEDNQLVPNNKGTVVGWGFTAEGKDPSVELKQLDVPVIDRGQCFDVVPDTFYQFLTQDKICAGFTNGSSVCNGDSGGGLVFYREENKKYYIRGLVSSGPSKENTCDSRTYGTYTRVSQYLPLLQKIESTNRE